MKTPQTSTIDVAKGLLVSLLDAQSIALVVINVANKKKDIFNGTELASELSTRITNLADIDP